MIRAHQPSMWVVHIGNALILWGIIETVVLEGRRDVMELSRVFTCSVITTIEPFMAERRLITTHTPVRPTY